MNKLILLILACFIGTVLSKQSCKTRYDCFYAQCLYRNCVSGSCQYGIPSTNDAPTCYDGNPNTNFDFCVNPNGANTNCTGLSQNLTYIFLTICAQEGLPSSYPFILQDFFSSALGIPTAQIHACYDYTTATGGLGCTFLDLTGTFTYQLNISSGGNGNSSQGGPAYAGQGSGATATAISNYINNNLANMTATLNITAAFVPCQPQNATVCIPQNRPRNLGIMIGLATFLFILTILICVIYYARKAHTWSKSYGATGGSTESTASMNEDMSGRSQNENDM